MSKENHEQNELPQELIEELRSVDRPVDMITSRVDREISTLARAQFTRRSRPRRIAMFAAAASVLLAVFVIQFRGPDLELSTDVYADLDASGHIDIADVLYLARRNKDQSEIDNFAMKVVALEPPGETS